MRVLPPNIDELRRIVHNTNKYINDYLTPDGDWNYYFPYKDRWHLIFDDAKNTDWETIAYYIKKMPYQEFLNTKYWKTITRQKKYFEPRCKKCGRIERLETHHPDYDIRGYEMYRMNELVVLCHGCHTNEHIDEINSELEIMRKQR
jgi:hypothetical protein